MQSSPPSSRLVPTRPRRLIPVSVLALGLGWSSMGCSDDESSSPGGQDGGGTGGGAAAGGSTSDGRGGASGGAMGEGGVTGVTGGSGAVDPPAKEEPICPEGPFGLPHADFASTTVESPALVAAVASALSYEVGGESVSIDLEGPVWSAAEGALFFSDKNPPWSDEADQWQEPGSGTIWRWVPGEEPGVHVLESGSNGLALDLDGNLLAATHGNRNLTRYDVATAETTLGVVLDDPNENNNTGKFNSPNDLTVSSGGHIYFTDPWYQNSQPSEERPPTAAYWVKPSGEVQQFRGGNPNGIALSPDEATLYVGLNGKVESWSLQASGEPVDSVDFVDVVGKWSDGFAVDCAGNLYVTEQADASGGVMVYDPSGTLLGVIDVGGTATNAAFGGADRKTLFVTRSKGLYTIELDVPGYPY